MSLDGRRDYGNAGDMRVLVRSVRGQLRGWLSDKYSRLDLRPLVEALAAEAIKAGAAPIDGVATERVSRSRSSCPVIEPIPGEFLAYGGEWSNGDVGNGVHSFRTFALRVVCLNGMTTREPPQASASRCTPRRRDRVSDRTHRLDTAASVSALRDIGSAGRGRLMETIGASHDRSINKSQVSTAMKALPKHVQKSVIDAFESSDVINLPEGKTV